MCKWLDELGLEQYKSSFETNAIDGTELEVITDSMLQQIGIGKQTSCPDIGPYYPLANEVAKGYSNATVLPSVRPSICPSVASL